MTISLTLNAESIDELKGALQNALANLGGAEAPAQAVAPTMPTGGIPMQVPSPIVPAVPTAVKGYTLDELSRAAAAVMEKVGFAPLQTILQEFGVPALTTLPQEKYGEFATKIRALGASI